MATDKVDGCTAHPIRYPLLNCPACGSEHLEPVVEEPVQAVHFLCSDCASCWNVELGYVQRVAPTACLGCPQRTRCERAYESSRR